MAGKALTGYDAALLEKIGYSGDPYFPRLEEPQFFPSGEVMEAPPGEDKLVLPPWKVSDGQQL